VVKSERSVKRISFNHRQELRLEEKCMDRFGILALLEAKEGKEMEVADFLRSARPLVLEEAGTSTWFAFQTGPSSFGIFDTFADEQGRKAHLTGELAKALFARAPELFVGEPRICMADILATK
jgi:quinol monooxygenase YgiN